MVIQHSTIYLEQINNLCCIKWMYRRYKATAPGLSPGVSSHCFSLQQSYSCHRVWCRALRPVPQRALKARAGRGYSAGMARRHVLRHVYYPFEEGTTTLATRPTVFKRDTKRATAVVPECRSGRSGTLRTACEGKSPAESGTATPRRMHVLTQNQQPLTSPAEGRVGPSTVGRGSSCKTFDTHLGIFRVGLSGVFFRGFVIESFFFN